MTHENLFKEIEEDLERQKYEALWKSYGGYVIALALIIVLGTAGYNFWQGHEALKRQRATGELAALVNAKADPIKQIEDLQAFAVGNVGKTQATLAALHAATVAAKQDRHNDAVKIYDMVASDVKADHAFRQLADLLSVQIQMETGGPAALQQRLQPLMADKEPWRYSAMEYSAFLAFRADDKEKAKKIFTLLSQDANAPEGMNVRATDMVRLLAE